MSYNRAIWMPCNPLFGWVATPYLDGLQPPIRMCCNPLLGWVATPYLDGLQPPIWMA